MKNLDSAWLTLVMLVLAVGCSGPNGQVPNFSAISLPAAVPPLEDADQGQESRVVNSPAPVTSAPVTSAPVTSAPVTSAPVTSAPVTPAPITPEPVTPEPVTPEPVTPEPVTPEPVTPEPVTPAPITPEPITPAPITPEPVTPEPVTSGNEGPAAPPAVVLVSRFFHPILAIRHYTVLAEEKALLLANGWIYEGDAFKLYTEPRKDCEVQLRMCWARGPGNNFVFFPSRSSTCEGHNPHNILGYACTVSAPDLALLRRYHRQVDYIATIAGSAEENTLVSYGFSLDGDLAYIPR